LQDNSWVHDINILAINTPRQLKFVALLDRLWHVHLNVSATTPNGGTQFHGWIDIKLDTNLEALGASQMQVFFFSWLPVQDRLWTIDRLA
jgi:hypothetical protein